MQFYSLITIQMDSSAKNWIKQVDKLIREDYVKNPDRSVRVYILSPSIKTTENYNYVQSNDKKSCGTSMGLGKGTERCVVDRHLSTYSSLFL